MLTLPLREIHFYYADGGCCPVRDFLDELPAKKAEKVVWTMQLVEDLERVPKQYFKKLVNTDHIWEIRTHYGSEEFRVLGFFLNFNIFVATNGFKKKTKKTPKQEILIAEKRKADYLDRRQK